MAYKKPYIISIKVMWMRLLELQKNNPKNKKLKSKYLLEDYQEMESILRH